MKRRTSLNLTCFAVAVVAALLATPPVQAEISNSQRLPARAEPVSELHPVTGQQHQVPNTVRPTDADKSYFWLDAGIAAAVFTGLLALGLWSDRAIGGVIFSIELLGMGAASTARKIRAHPFVPVSDSRQTLGLKETNETREVRDADSAI